MRFLKEIWPTLKRYRRQYATGLTLVLVAAILGAAGPLLIREAIDRLDSGDPGAVTLFALALVLVGAARALFNFRGRFSIIAASRRFEYDLREQIYAKLMRLPTRFFDLNASGDIQSRVINDVDGVRMVAGIATMIVVSSGMLFILSLGAMLMLDPVLAILVLLPLACTVAITTRLTGRIYRESEALQDRLGDLSTIAQENFSGVRILRAFSRAKAQNQLFAKRAGRYRDANLTLSRTRAKTWGLLTLFMELSFGITLLVGGLGIMNGTMTKGDFVAFMSYQFLLVWPVIAMGWIVTIVQRGAACWERLSKILAAADDEPADLPPVPPPARGEIEIRGLTFGYADDREPALRDLNLKIAAGERVVLVGRTGSGKSTLISILLGLYRPPRGTVFIDGRDINDYPRKALRESLGSVPQDIFLFSDSISANIAFGAAVEAGSRASRTPSGSALASGDAVEAGSRASRTPSGSALASGDGPDNGTSKESILEAAESSRISEDLPRFPNGIETVIGERGVTLSGGQKQRTALARALIRRPRILLLDDALSSVDIHTEHEILDRLDPWLKGRTCLIATHRFSIASRVDRVLVLDEGRLVEEGTHAELAAKGGLYARLLTRQNLEEALEKDP